MSLRKTRKALQEGSVKLCSQGEVFVMERRLEGELLVTAINNTDLSQRCVLKGTSSRDLLGGDLYTGERETLSIELPPFTSMILKLV